MSGIPKIARRRAFSSLLFPLLGAGFAPMAFAAVAQRSAISGVLVAYLSRSGNTRVIAGQIKRQFEADLFEIRTADPYPEDYEQAVERARIERDAKAAPRLAERLGNTAADKTVFLGFPIWGMAMPAPVRSFLTIHDLAGKSLVPFITHGGYGTGSALRTLEELAPRAQILESFVMQADQERDTMNRVSGWLRNSRF
jgi:flavodoxin